MLSATQIKKINFEVNYVHMHTRVVSSHAQEEIQGFGDLNFPTCDAHFAADGWRALLDGVFAHLKSLHELGAMHPLDDDAVVVVVVVDDDVVVVVVVVDNDLDDDLDDDVDVDVDVDVDDVDAVVDVDVSTVCVDADVVCLFAWFLLLYIVADVDTIVVVDVAVDTVVVDVAVDTVVVKRQTH
jgi:hypothetical protein